MAAASKLIVMLTHDDLTVSNACALFEQCKKAKAQFWGFKEEPLPLPEMKSLCAAMRAAGKTTVLEVVAYTETECLQGARTAAACGFDILMGTSFFDSVNDLCKANHLRYMPFVGAISGRPSVLCGNIEDMIAHAKRCVEKGVYGFDLLGYRYVGDAAQLIRRFVEEIDAPVCVAGSINSFARLDEIKRAAPWAFTIGSAFFRHTFGGTLPQQIDTVCAYMEEPGR